MRNADIRIPGQGHGLFPNDGAWPRLSKSQTIAPLGKRVGDVIGKLQCAWTNLRSEAGLSPLDQIGGGQNGITYSLCAGKVKLLSAPTKFHWGDEVPPGFVVTSISSSTSEEISRN